MPVMASTGPGAALGDLPAPADFFIPAETKAKAASLLASRADTWEVAALTSMPTSGTTTPSDAREIFAALNFQATVTAKPQPPPALTGLAAMEAESAAMCQGLSGASSWKTAAPAHKGPPTTCVPPAALTVNHMG